MAEEFELERIVSGGDRDTLVIFFGGMAKAWMGIPPFEFLNFFSRKFPDVDSIFYKDIHQAFYRKGFPGVSDSHAGSAEYLRAKIRGYKRVVFCGVSSGGYAAILFGSMLEVDTVLAFGPPTDLPSGYNRDLIPFFNSTTRYILRTIPGDGLHADRHVHRVARLGRPNIECSFDGTEVLRLRDNGGLHDLIHDAIYST